MQLKGGRDVIRGSRRRLTSPIIGSAFDNFGAFPALQTLHETAGSTGSGGSTGLGGP